MTRRGLVLLTEYTYYSGHCLSFPATNVARFQDREHACPRKGAKLQNAPVEVKPRQQTTTTTKRKKEIAAWPVG